MLLPPRFLRAAVVLVALAAVLVALAAVGCGPDVMNLWICINPATGKLDTSIGDPNHYVDGMADPCHCYDPCGPAPTCPFVVDAGPLPPGCDAGAGGTGADGG